MEGSMVMRHDAELRFLCALAGIDHETQYRIHQVNDPAGVEVFIKDKDTPTWRRTEIHDGSPLAKLVSHIPALTAQRDQYKASLDAALRGED